MLSKNPKPFYRKLLIKGATILFVAEAAAFVGCYFVWSKLNTDRGNEININITIRLQFTEIGSTTSSNVL